MPPMVDGWRVDGAWCTSHDARSHAWAVALAHAWISALAAARSSTLSSAYFWPRRRSHSRSVSALFCLLPEALFSCWSQALPARLSYPAFKFDASSVHMNSQHQQKPAEHTAECPSSTLPKWHGLRGWVLLRRDSLRSGVVVLRVLLPCPVHLGRSLLMAGQKSNRHHVGCHKKICDVLVGTFVDSHH